MGLQAGELRHIAYSSIFFGLVIKCFMVLNKNAVKAYHLPTMDSDLSGIVSNTSFFYPIIQATSNLTA